MSWLKSGCNFVLLLTVILGASPGAAAQTIHLPPHEKVVFKNGLTVLLLEKHGVPIVNFVALVKTGAAADPSGEEGLASITAELLRKGTEKRTAQQFASEIDFTGGSFEAGAGSDFSIASAEFLNKDLTKGLDLLSDALLHPMFPQEEVEKLLAQSLDGVRSAKDEARSVLGIYYNGYLYNGNCSGGSENGDELSLKRIHREAIDQFYGKYYTPGNTILAVAGDFQGAEMKKRLEDIFAPWPSKPITAVKISTIAAVKGKKLLLVD
jgi:zinc protease